MNKKQPETTLKTQQAIKDAFWSLYKQQKIETISVKDITTKAGYNRSTFYVYFKDVYDVLEQIESELMPGVEDLPSIDFSQQAHADVMENMMTIYEKNGDYYSVLLSEKGDPYFATKLKNVFKSMMCDALGPLINPSDMEVDYALEFLVSGTLAIVKHWYDMGKSMPIEKLMPMMHKLMANQFVEDFRLSAKKD